MNNFAQKYGSWAIVTGATSGTGLHCYGDNGETWHESGDHCPSKKDEKGELEN